MSLSIWKEIIMYRSIFLITIIIDTIFPQEIKGSTQITILFSKMSNHNEKRNFRSKEIIYGNYNSKESNSRRKDNSDWKNRNSLRGKYTIISQLIIRIRMKKFLLSIRKWILIAGLLKYRKLWVITVNLIRVWSSLKPLRLKVDIEKARLFMRSIKENWITWKNNILEILINYSNKITSVTRMKSYKRRFMNNKDLIESKPLMRQIDRVKK